MFQGHVGARADEEDRALGVFLAGEDTGVGKELVVKKRHDGGVGEGEMLEEGGVVGDMFEAVIGEEQGVTILVQVEGDLGNTHRGGNVHLFNSMVAYDGCVEVDALVDRDEMVVVHNPVVGHEDGVIFRLSDGLFPSLRPDVLLETFDTCSQLIETPAVVIRFCHRTRQLVLISSTRLAQDDDFLDVAEVEKWSQKGSTTG